MYSVAKKLSGRGFRREVRPSDFLIIEMLNCKMVPISCSSLPGNESSLLSTLFGQEKLSFEKGETEIFRAQ